MDSKAKAKAKEEKANQNATIAEPLGISRESALISSKRVRTRAKDSKDNATSAEKSDIQPASSLK